MTKDHVQQQARTIHVLDHDHVHNNALNLVHLHDLFQTEMYMTKDLAQQLVQAIHVHTHNVEKQEKNI
eukprot:8581287-Prorocentrum_lima.AAC.1